MDYLIGQLENLYIYITGPDLWMTMGKGALQIILIIVLAKIVVRFGKSIINRIFRQRKRRHFQITKKRETTLKKLLENAFTYIVYFTAIIMILDTVTIEVGALLASAGIAGLAIGFGAQNLVKDIISGFFVIFEDQFSVGDYIRVAGIEGFVEEIGIRTTKVLSWTGELHIIPNGGVDHVTNYSVHNSIAVVDVNIPYESNSTKAEQVIEEALSDLPDHYPQLTNPPELLGVQNFESSYIVLRIIAEVQPMEHWEMGRIMRKLIMEKLADNNIDVPMPRLVMYSRNESPTTMEIPDRKSVV